jgi:hypothetical protein
MYFALTLLHGSIAVLCIVSQCIILLCTVPFEAMLYLNGSVLSRVGTQRTVVACEILELWRTDVLLVTDHNDNAACCTQPHNSVC